MEENPSGKTWHGKYPAVNKNQIKHMGFIPIEMIFDSDPSAGKKRAWLPIAVRVLPVPELFDHLKGDDPYQFRQ